ncbi:MAG TPA: bifunctional DNA-binding transcriptional regulator/O6-methylguanine-DNA methyltransferase Ada [Gemmatimonadaceae bacterium]|jgi:AraC family transcriptional regulator of adaptative response/methylated-DNA-[protein]-cysteine methyltransferase|nr:bifunctional DNA-binding transcriptional regulator/O6-methylguanine-DNA methyltransferase Ada [Gemmatimonadaceae bacterium]
MCAAACYDFLIEGNAREVGSIKTKVQAEAPLVNEATAWESVLQRDASADDRFLYAVTTTGIYCRPSCPSRRPKRDNVAFFSSAAAAEEAGFRACQRCRPNRAKTPNRAIERAREYIDTHIADLGEERITLELLGEQSGLSPYHLQRKFKEIVGLTPAQYVRARKSELLKGELKRGETVSRATFGAGYGSSSRVYGDSDKRLGMTPATYRRGGAGAHIEYVTARTSLGILLVGATDRGVCAVTLGNDVKSLEGALELEYPAATRTHVSHPSSSLRAWVADIIEVVDSDRVRLDIPFDIQASAFQWKVWRELQKIPFGETRSYGEIANAIGAPKAVRAVASACANNRAAVIIPCHRVVRQNGELGGYRWGLERKQRLIEKERAMSEKSTS